MVAPASRADGALAPDVGDRGCGSGRGGRFGWIPLVVVAGVLATLIVVGWFAAWPHGSGPVPPFWPFLPFGFLLVVVLVVLAFRASGRGPGGWASRQWSYPESAEEIVRSRYARGEITSQQLHEMLRELDDRSV
jgi:uncharacterized membrane protein